MKRILDFFMRAMFDNYFRKMERLQSIREAPEVVDQGMSWSESSGPHLIDFTLDRRLRDGEHIGVLWEVEYPSDKLKKESPFPLRVKQRGNRFEACFNPKKERVEEKNIRIWLAYFFEDFPPIKLHDLPGIFVIGDY